MHCVHLTLDAVVRSVWERIPSLHTTFLTVPLKHRHAAPRAPCELTRRHSSHAIKMVIDFAVIDIDFAVIKLIQPWAN